jgi:Zn-dependent carboxypeptidase
MNHYDKLASHFRKISRLSHLGSICGWDQAAMMPSGGNQARGEAMAELAVVMHELATAPQLADWFATAKQEELNDAQRVSLQTMERSWQLHTVVPAYLVEAKTLAESRCEHAWREQRKNNDWKGFLPNLTEVLNLAREEAAIRADVTGTSAYDALLDLYEPGMTCAQLDVLFGDLTTWLPELIRAVEEKQKTRTFTTPEGPFPTEKQKALGQSVMGLLGFDFNHGRLDVSTHPFCGGVPTDVRITTRYDEADFMTALLGVIHETGHARYEQNLPQEWAGLPVGQARSMGVHESQSLFFEMQLARSREFTHQLAPLAARILAREDDPAFAVDNIYRFNTRMKRGYIRVNADEVTYPAHVILRYEIERALIQGDIEVTDIPELWDQKMQAYLGLSTRDNYRDGCMQDIHWTGGSFGYFPTYTLGAMYAAQLFAAAEKSMPNLRENIQRGELTELFNWLKTNIWQKASTLSTDELIRSATGESLNPAYFQRHLRARYL